MPTSPARPADDIADTIRSMVDRMVDAKVTHEMTRRGQELASILAERGGEVGARAEEAWRESKPMRRDAAKQLTLARKDLAKWSDRTWRSSLRPMLKDLWKRRTLAIGAAGAAVPAGREVVDEAAARLGLRRREERHWGSFLLGLAVGAAAGAIIALLTTPKRGTEMRHELGARADEIASKARDEWVPIFQRGEATNGHASELGSAEPTRAQEAATLQEGATEAGIAGGGSAEQAAADTSEAINETFESPDRQA